MRSRQNSLAIIFPEVTDIPEELLNSSSDEEPESDLVEGNEDPDHHYPCNMEFHEPEEVERSQKVRFYFSIGDPLWLLVITSDKIKSPDPKIYFLQN